MPLPNVYSLGLFITVVGIVAASFASLWKGGITQLLVHDFFALVAVMVTLHVVHADPPLEPLRARRLLTVVAAILAMTICTG